MNPFTSSACLTLEVTCGLTSRVKDGAAHGLCFTACSRSYSRALPSVQGGGLWVLNRGARWGVCAGVGREARLDPWDIVHWFFREGYSWDSSRETPACLSVPVDTDCPDRASGPRLSFHPRIVSELWTHQGAEQEGEDGLAQRVPSVLGRQWVPHACVWVRELDLCVKDTHFTQLLRHHDRC